MKKELIVLTGASGGIGSAAAKAFHQAGHPLLLLGQQMNEIKKSAWPQTLYREVDVVDLDSFQRAVNEAESEFGPTGCLINNAGIMLLGQVDTQAPEEWTKMVNVNVLGVLNGVRTVLKGMRQRKSGTIINLSSIAGKKSFANHSAYTATKFAVHGMTENLREENARYGVRFITLAPGVVDTGLLSHTTSFEIKQSYTEWKKNLGTVLQPEELAEIILFAYRQPKHVCLRELVVATTSQEP